MRKTKNLSEPGSCRRSDYVDRFYLHGTLGATPTHYVQICGEGIRIISPLQVTISAPNVLIDGILSAGSEPHADAATINGFMHVISAITAAGVGLAHGHESN